MSRSKKWYTARNPVRGLAGLVAMLSALLMTTGCDGGLFGTGDGTEISEDLAATDLGDTDGIPTDPETDSAAGSPEGETNGSATESSEDNNQGQILSFSNTLPSGLNSDIAPLPALKAINLTEVTVSIEALGNVASGITIEAPADTTSNWLSVNIGETDISLSATAEGTQLASISPLNSAEDSLTSIVISGSFDNPDSLADTGEGNGVSVLALETRAAVSASDMAEVRLIRMASQATTDNDTQLPNQYLLTPDEGNADGVELVFTMPDNGSAQSSSYQLAVPGEYTIGSNGSSALNQQITLEENAVYTLIVTSDLQRPVYIEVDSREPLVD